MQTTDQQTFMNIFCDIRLSIAEGWTYGEITKKYEQIIAMMNFPEIEKQRFEELVRNAFYAARVKLDYDTAAILAPPTT